MTEFWMTWTDDPNQVATICNNAAKEGWRLKSHSPVIGYAKLLSLETGVRHFLLFERGS